MRISYVTTYNASDIHNWSGLGYSLAKALTEQQMELDFVGDLKLKHLKALKLKRLLYKAFGKRFLIERNVSVAKYYASQIEKRLSPLSDCVLSPGSLPLAYLETRKPKVFYTDATFAGMVGFYENFSNLAAGTLLQGNRLEQAALDSCSMAIYASDWAAKTALENYSVDPGKVKVVPFGGSIDCRRSYADIKKIIQDRSNTTCKLLFLGVEWARKGGDLALQINDELNRAGLHTELHIAGIRTLPFAQLPGNVVNHGFISKSSADGMARIEKLLAQSHFLVVPTRAEAYGLVFCEANSFGVPAIATRVGGVPTIVRDDLNGRLFSLSATAADYAKYIMNVFTDYRQYEVLALSSFHEFQSRLNWKVSGQRIIELLKSL